MRRIAQNVVLTLACKGHFYCIFFDPADRSALLDHLFELAQAPDCPLRWQDVFSLVDMLATAPQAV